MRAASGWLLCLAGAWLVAASCAVPSFKLLDSETSVSTSSSSSAGAGGSTGSSSSPGGGGCQHLSWPDPPAASDPGADSEDFVMAVRSADFGEADLTQGAKIGYDLDNRCTCDGDDQSCTPPEFAKGENCDGPGGIDNTAAHIFAAASLFNKEITSKFHSQRANDGQWSLLLRVRQYNGQANDDQISVSIYPSPGFALDPCNPKESKPKWQGDDVWPVAVVSVEKTGGQGGQGGCSSQGASGYDINAPKYVDDNAYVSDHVLVANMPSAGLLLSSATNAVHITFTAGFFTGKLEKQALGWYLKEGILAGRWKVTELFKTLSTLASGGEPLCTDHQIYSLVKTAVCGYPDISSDLGGQNELCDAVSFGMKIEAEPALFGVVHESVEPVAECPAETDPAADNCETDSG